MLTYKQWLDIERYNKMNSIPQFKVLVGYQVHTLYRYHFDFLRDIKSKSRVESHSLLRSKVLGSRYDCFTGHGCSRPDSLLFPLSFFIIPFLSSPSIVALAHCLPFCTRLARYHSPLSFFPYLSPLRFWNSNGTYGQT